MIETNKILWMVGVGVLVIILVVGLLTVVVDWTELATFFLGAFGLE